MNEKGRGECWKLLFLGGALLVVETVGLSLLHAAAVQEQAVSRRTYHGSNMRLGQNVEEEILTPALVSSGQFGPLFSHPLDGDVYAQPLIAAGVSIPSRGTHNVVYIATEHDTVYAFDADSGDAPNDQPLWSTSFISERPGVSTVSFSDVGCRDLSPEIGITGTPVIDPATQTLYVVVRTKEDGSFVQRLHALDITTGEEKPGSPVEIAFSGPGNGEGSTGGVVAFDPLRLNQRTGLLLSGGLVYVAWASHCDISPYHGWVASYDAGTLDLRATFNATPDGIKGGIWMSGGAPAADATGNVYVGTGNGTFDAAAGGANYGESALKLSPDLGLIDFFTPYNQAQLSRGDYDFGSIGPVILPDQPEPHTRLVIFGAKDGGLYLLDRDDLGKYDPTVNRVVQVIPDAFANGAFGTPAYWNQRVYCIGSGGVVKAYQLQDGALSPTPVATGTHVFPYPGAAPVVSANGDTDGILWAIERNASQQAVVHAFDATDVSRELYNSAVAGILLGQAVKFTSPEVANGKLYVPTSKLLTVFGLLPPTPSSSPTPTVSFPPSPSPSLTASPTPAATLTPPVTAAASSTATVTVAPSLTSTQTNSPTPTATHTPTALPSRTPSPTTTATIASPTRTASPTASPSASPGHGQEVVTTQSSSGCAINYHVSPSSWLLPLTALLIQFCRRLRVRGSRQ